MRNKIVALIGLFLIAATAWFMATHPLSASSFVPASSINGLQYPCYHCCAPMFPICGTR